MALKRRHDPQRFVGDLLRAEISEKQARAASDEAGHLFQYEAGHLYRSEAGRDSDFKPATQRLLPRIAAMMFRHGGLVKRGDFGPAEGGRMVVYPDSLESRKKLAFEVRPDSDGG